MNYIEKNEKIIMTEFDSFDIEQILECGQCFRFTKLAEKEYVIVAHKRVLHIKQENEKVFFYPCNKKEFEEIWIDYFDLNRDYNEIKKLLSKDKVVKAAIEYASGIRILNQEPWECLISFIISQNNRIPMIKQVIKNISEAFGQKAGDYYLFPNIKELEKADNESLMACKTGFRAKYILDAIEKISSKEVDLASFSKLTTEEARKKLIEIKGVGPKVADCVLLFSLRRNEVFPTDVWVKRVMEYFYFDEKETPIKDIHSLAYKLWGDYAGFAQQYLFYYARSLKIGVK